jgi:hypothetical protein
MLHDNFKTFKDHQVGATEAVGDITILGEEDQQPHQDSN